MLTWRLCHTCIYVIYNLHILSTLSYASTEVLLVATMVYLSVNILHSWKYEFYIYSSQVPSLVSLWYVVCVCVFCGLTHNYHETADKTLLTLTWNETSARTAANTSLRAFVLLCLFDFCCYTFPLCASETKKPSLIKNKQLKSLYKCRRGKTGVT